ncbi:MAG TPA: acylphosphatase [Methanothrix sp.]|nr:acylphosphatase [Methanothrix sp.]HPJ84139.1 acylphosphatase [Methanothrix sp.]HPR66509.1 acylphosphatase [Methanothrix sp.]
MQRVEIIASGHVQRVGFRDLVEKIAQDLGLSGTVENQEPYDVAIVAEGEEGALKEFVKALRVEKGQIQVRDLEVRWEKATGEFPYFKILRGDWQEELGERFDVAVGLLYRSAELGEENLAIGKKMLEKQDVMIERQDETIGEIRGMRSDFQDHMDRRFAKIEGEIAEIKAAIAEIKGNG